MFKNMVLTISLLLMIPVLLFGESFDLNSFKDSALESRELAYQLQRDDVYVEDSVRYDYEKSPAKAFLMSAIIPGAGELYTGHWGRAAGFLGMEALFWTMHFVKKGEGQDLEEEYKAAADEQWDFDKWMSKSEELSSDFPSLFGPDGSHQIWVIVEVEQNGEWVPVDESAYKVEGKIEDVKNELNSLQSKYNGRIVPIRTRDFYENIGKYKQFACGWEDFDNEDIVVNDKDIVKDINSDMRNKYINKREESNDALKMATNFSTAVIINHVISAFHAQIMAKHYDSQDITWNINLMTNVREKYLFNGINFSVNF
jgi:hypothetical protein